MASSSILFPLLASVIFGLVFFTAPSSSSITCSDVIKDLRPCINYLRGGSGAAPPPSPCCAGALNLATSATTTVDKQTACACLKNAAKNINLNPDLAKALPSKCGISLSFQISPTVDCSKIG
ncbi:hypothetical protein ABFX02_14G164100 [Erythranthe guttata]